MAQYQRSLYLLLTPFLLGSILLVIVPLLYTAGLAFTRYDGLSAPTWYGLTNFRVLASDPLFLKASTNSLLFIGLTIPLRLLITLGLALLLNYPRTGVVLYRALIYIPTVIPSVAYALVWLWIFNPLYGPLNLFLTGVGLPTIAWLADSRTALVAIAFTALFQIGEGFVFLLAGLHEIPDEYYAAASIDGAGWWSMLRHITLPLVAPWLLLLIIRDIIVSAQSTFAPAFIMTGGGPYYATLFMPLLIFKTAFDRFRFGDASAMTLIMLIVVALLVVIAYTLLGGWGYEDEV